MDVAFVTKDSSYTPTHLRIEQKAISLANDANRFAVENAVIPSEFEACENTTLMQLYSSLVRLVPVFKELNESSKGEEKLNQVFCY